MNSYRVRVRAILETGKPHYMNRIITESELSNLRQSNRFTVVSCVEVVNELRSTTGLVGKAFIDAILHNTALANSNKYRKKMAQHDKPMKTCVCCGSDSSLGYVEEDRFYCSWMCCEKDGGDGMNAKFIRVEIYYKEEFVPS